MQGGSYLLRFKTEKMDHYEVDKWTEAKNVAQHFLTGGVAMYIFLMILLKALTCKGVKL